MALCRMLASLTNADGSIAIPGIYEQVKPLTDDERQSIQALPGRRKRTSASRRAAPGGASCSAAAGTRGR